LIKITGTLVLFFFVPWVTCPGIKYGYRLASVNPEHPRPPKRLQPMRRPNNGRQNSFKHFFQQGYDYYSKQKFQPAAEHLLQFLSARTPDDQDYEWAEFFYGMSLYKLGFTHAAVDTLTHLVTRKPNPQIVTYVLELLERISRTLPHDKDMLINRALCDQSYGFVEGPVTDFIHYYQGEYDWEHGFLNGEMNILQTFPKTPSTTTNICLSAPYAKFTAIASTKRFAAEDRRLKIGKRRSA
jgi:hypothetical protein